MSEVAPDDIASLPSQLQVPPASDGYGNLFSSLEMANSPILRPASDSTNDLMSGLIFSARLGDLEG